MLFCTDFLEEKKLFKVFEGISDTKSQWKNIGRALGLSSSVLDGIEKKNDTNQQDCLYDMLEKWIATGKATFEDLLSALESKLVGYKDFTTRIRTLSLKEKREKFGL